MATQQEVMREQAMQDEGSYLPSPDRKRAGMQLELQDNQRLTVQQFMAESEHEDRDKEDLYSENNF